MASATACFREQEAVRFYEVALRVLDSLSGSAFGKARHQLDKVAGSVTAVELA